MAHIDKKHKRNEDVKNSIDIGSDMISEDITLQKARPWYLTEEEGSNLNKDNAVTLKELFDGKKVVVFGVPAPFTGTCTNEHYPPYKEKADEFLKEGVGKIVCYSVSDPYAHHAWAKALNNDFDKIQFLADADASFAHEYGLEMDASVVALGTRSQRFSMLVENGIVKIFRIIGPEDDASKDAEMLLGDIKKVHSDEGS